MRERKTLSKPMRMEGRGGGGVRPREVRGWLNQAVLWRWREAQRG